MRDTVLIVDENTEERVIAQALIRSREIPVRTADDGTQAWEVLVRDCRAVALLIIDLELGATGMNGWELLRCVRGRFGGLPLAQQPQIAVMLRQTRPEAACFARRLGASMVLHKPLVPRELIAAVEHAVVGARTSSKPRARTAAVVSGAGSPR